MYVCVCVCVSVCLSVSVSVYRICARIMEHCYEDRTYVMVILLTNLRTKNNATSCGVDISRVGTWRKQARCNVEVIWIYAECVCMCTCHACVCDEEHFEEHDTSHAHRLASLTINRLECLTQCLFQCMLLSYNRKVRSAIQCPCVRRTSSGRRWLW